MTMFRNVCRLCFGEDDLIWIFGDRMADNMKEIIHVTSGVEICRTDNVTQMVCSTCCQVTIKMYQFRTKSIKNDKDLKARYAGYNIAQLSNAAANATKQEQTNATPVVTTAPVSTTSSVVTTSSAVTNNGGILKNLSITIKAKPPQLPARYRSAHPSVKDVVMKNPKIVLPQSCLKSHVGAYITLLTDEVHEYYREKSFTDAQIAKIIKEACEVDKKSPLKRRKPMESVGSSTLTSTLVTTVKKAKLNVEPVEKSTQKSVATRPKTPGITSSSRSCSDNSKTKERISIATPTFESLLHQSNDKKEETVKHKKDAITLKYLLQSSKDEFTTRQQQLATSTDKSMENAKSSQTMKTQRTVSPAHKNMDTARSSPTIKIQRLVSSADKSMKPARYSPIQQLTDSEDEVIKPKRIAKSTRNRISDSCMNLTDEELDFFTSRPFVNDAKENSKKNETPVAVHNENAQDGEKTTNNASLVDNDNSSDSDPIVFDLDSRGSASTSTKSSSDVDKNAFTEALRLVPRPADGNSSCSNMPDFSLVSFAAKSHTLYTCRVCDSQHTSRKEMKIHERRTHTKCPFCNRRFRTLANRDVHVANDCAINRSPPVQLKNPRLELKRIDEDEEVRKKYPSAFGDSAKKTSTPVTQDEGLGKTKEASLKKNAGTTEGKKTVKAKTTGNEEVIIDVESYKDKSEVPIGVCDGDTALAIGELEQFFNYAEVVPVEDSAVANSGGSQGQDVICISDDESDPAPRKRQEPERLPQQTSTMVARKPGEMTINVVNSEILKNVNLHDNDLNVLKTILSHNEIREGVTQQLNQWNLTNNLIIDGSTPRVKIFKNLRRYLHQYKVPIEIKHGPKVTVQYQPRTPPPPKRLTGLWTNKPVETLKPLKATAPTPLPSQHANIVLNGQVAQTTPAVAHKISTVNKPATVPTTSLIFTSATPTITSSTPIVLNGQTATSNSILFKPSPYPYFIVANLQNYMKETTAGGPLTAQKPAVTTTAPPTSIVGTVTSIQQPLSSVAGVVSATFVQQPPSSVGGVGAATTSQPVKTQSSGQSSVATTTSQPIKIQSWSIGNVTTVAGVSNVATVAGVSNVPTTSQPVKIQSWTADKVTMGKLLLGGSAAAQSKPSPSGVGAAETAVAEPSLSASVAQLESITQALMPAASQDNAVVTSGEVVSSVVGHEVSSHAPPAIRVRDLKELS